jgi:hypothetical protein
MTAHPAASKELPPKPARKPRTCGFQCNGRDGLILVGGAAVTWLAWPYLGEAILLVPIAVGHFFLFCNVFRIHRKLEYAWAAAFILNVAGWSLAGSADWARILAVQTPLTLALIGWEMSRPRYHGLGARSINRRSIDAWLRGEIH